MDEGGTHRDQRADSTKDSPEHPQVQIDASITLQFPTIPVHGTPAGWLSRSQLVAPAMMASYHDDSSCEDTTSSLGDSNYDFIEDRSMVTTDDDEEPDQLTASTTSSDGIEVERPEVGGVRSAILVGIEDSPVSLQTPTASGQLEEAVDVKERVQPDLPEVVDHIVFEEPSVINLKSSEAIDVACDWRGRLNTYEYEKYMSNIPRGIKQAVCLTVEQSMARRNLDLKSKVYKIVYTGPPEFKEPIIQKIGAALASSSGDQARTIERPNRFNVVPISAFGDTQNPEVVLIDSSGIEIAVEEVAVAKVSSRPAEQQGIVLFLSDGSRVVSSYGDHKFVVTHGWDLPDLAISFISRDGKAGQHLLFKDFMERHGVKTIAISSDIRADLNMVLDQGTPQLCFEYQALDASPQSVMRAVPINLASFQSIDAGQMNRNLAYLASSKSEVNLPQSDFHESTHPLYSKGQLMKHINEVKDNLLTFNRNTPTIPQLLVLLLAITYGLWMSSVALSNTINPPGGLDTEVTTHSSSPVSSVSSTSVSLSSLGVVSPTASTAPRISRTSLPKALSTPSDFASLLLDAYAPPPNKSDQFKVHVLGDCHIILRPPHWLTKLRKSPPLSFRVSRKDAVVDQKASSLFDGVYALQIPREEAYGVLTVRITTGTRPLVDESFEVDFGSSWLKVMAWKRAARALTDAMQHDLTLMQSSLSVVYSQTKTELSTFVRSTKEHMTNRTTRRREGPLSGARAILVAQTKDLSQTLARKLHNGRKGTAKTLQMLSRDLQAVQRDLQAISQDLYSISISIRMSAPMDEGARVVSRRIQSVTRPAAKMVQSMDENLAKVRAHYKAYQKGALKAWWRIRGVPKGPKLDKRVCGKRKGSGRAK